MKAEIKERIEKIMQGQVPYGYKKTKRGIIPDDWEIKVLNNILKKTKKAVKVEPDMLYKQIGIRSHGKGIFYKEEVTGKELGNKSVFWIEPDRFIVNIVFAWEMAIAKTTINETGMIASHRFPMYKVVKDKLDLDYITYFFKSVLGKELLGLASPGGAGRNKTLGQQEFIGLEIPISTNVLEQKKIASILSTWDKAIELKEQFIELKMEQQRDLMNTLLTGKKRLKGFVGEWKIVKLSELGEFKTSSVDKKINEDEKLVKLLNYMDVYKNKLIDCNIDFMKVSATEVKINSFSLRYGDVLFTPSSETPDDIGHSAVFKMHDKDILYSYHLVRLRFNQEMDIDFKGYVFNVDYLLKEFGKRATGVTRCTLSIKDFNEVEIKIPENLEEQKAIAAILITSDKEIKLLKQELELLKRQKKGLMQLLLTGLVRVNLQ